MHRNTVVIAATLIACAASVIAGDSTKELVVDLKFAPQEGVHASSADLAPSMIERTVALTIEDGRGQADPLVIGDGTNDDDKPFPIRASTEPKQYAAAAAEQIVTSWGLKTATPADRQLVIRLMRFYVNEGNKALGSVYASEVKVTYKLSDKNGKALAEGAASGTAHRYGRARSAQNCSEVLSDAFKEAVANTLSDSVLQSAWASGKGTAASTTASAPAKESVEERLKKLDDLLKKGLITKDEHQKRRAEILKEI
ncbi:MAG: YajG family lipoprotein [Acidobacteriota bacterium]